MQGISYENQRAMIIAPHADDETLGCGGVIQRYLAAGSEVHILFASFLMGETHRYKKSEEGYKIYRGDKRLRELKRAMGILGVSDYHILFQDDSDSHSFHTKLDALPRLELVERIEAQIDNFKPTVIFVPSITKHQDHEALHLAALTATRPYFWNGSVLIYETDGERSFHPNLFTPLSKEQMAVKMKALRAYKTQLQPYPHPVSEEAVLHKAKFRGQQIYEDFAEAFQVLRLHG